MDTAKFTVDYELEMPTLMRAGKYDGESPWLTCDRFPPTRRGCHNVEIGFIHFRYPVTTAEALGALDAEGVRPANVSELLTIGMECPELQQWFPIVALGQVWHWMPAIPLAVSLDADDGLNRHVRLVGANANWTAGFRFAAALKDTRVR